MNQQKNKTRMKKKTNKRLQIKKKVGRCSLFTIQNIIQWFYEIFCEMKVLKRRNKKINFLVPH
jgi:hypothetical protein